MICRRIFVNVMFLLAACFILLIPVQAQNAPTKEPQNLLLKSGQGQNQHYGSPNQLDPDRYRTLLLGSVDKTETVYVYAMAKVKKSEEGTLRSVPHQEVIALGAGTPQVEVLAKFEGALWVHMVKVKSPSENPTLYFAVTYPNDRNRYFKYQYHLNTKTPLEEIIDEGQGKDATVLLGLKIIARRVPLDSFIPQIQK